MADDERKRHRAPPRPLRRSRRKPGHGIRRRRRGGGARADAHRACQRRLRSARSGFGQRGCRHDSRRWMCRSICSIVDVVMPGMVGPDLARLTRQRFPRRTDPLHHRVCDALGDSAGILRRRMRRYCRSRFFPSNCSRACTSGLGIEHMTTARSSGSRPTAELMRRRNFLCALVVQPPDARQGPARRGLLPLTTLVAAVLIPIPYTMQQQRDRGD